ncbi:PREDICTED: C-type lectin domain family 4 member M-like [Branchiostoma belcheri]|uniref:C-type lectin domain family 4 member M-like n=1 Tax=Branchiostoma belcheri TaxID=7741 RepID=A0A6P4YNV4_BRABE|nr:PREDICTED: C-type lectin domain family 4 member M-like [Branchiostoma belcheri]
MQQPEPYWRSRADAAAKLPNPMYASNADGAYPGGASGRRGVCSFLRARHICLAAGIAMLLSLGVVGLAPLTFSNKQEISQLSTIVKRDLRRLSTTVNALKRDQADMSAIVDALKRDQDNIRQLSNTVDALKRELDSERNRTATSEQRLNEKTLPSCPEGYTMWRGICYKAFNTSKTFSEAGAACRADGGTLAMPRDAETNAFLISLYMSVRDEFFFWIGLHDRCEEGRFEWMDGSALGPYSSWGQGQPSNNQDQSDCVAYSGYLSPCLKDKWYDAPCDAEYYYICQTVPAGTHCIRIIF